MTNMPRIRTNHREPQLLRFRLWQLMAFVAFCSVLLTLMTVADGPGPMVIGVATLLVAAHVIGNLIGTRLRDTSQDVSRWRVEQLGTDDMPRVPDARETQAQLELRTDTPLAAFGQTTRWVIWLVVAGSTCGALLGSFALALTLGTSIGWAGWTVGTISCAVLGAWAAFLASSFSSIARHAWRDAHGNES